MVEFETIKAETKNFGKNDKNFIEVARKKAKSEKGETEFLAISRGFTPEGGDKRYTKSVAIPVTKEMVEFISTTLKKCVE